MNNTLMYFLKVNIAIALFYLFYRLFFSGDTFWKTRRYYMLFSILLSFVYPFLSVENWLQKQEPVFKLIVDYTTLPELTVTPVQKTNIFSLENILMAIYGLVVLILLVRFIIQLVSILLIRLQGTLKTVQDTKIIAINKEVTPFSFFGSVFMNPDMHNEHETKEILAHELTHVHQGHSFDVLVSELLSIVFWFNPATWLLKREIRQNLEFLADNKVIESGFDSQTYQYHLLQLSYQTPEHKLGNKFNISPLKKRITMMNKQKTSKASLLKYSLIVPLALALVLSSNAQTVINKAKKALTTTEKSATSGEKVVASKSIVKFIPPVIKEDTAETEKVYDEVEKMPVFPGGEKEMMNYLAINVRYPIEAQKSGAQGTVLVKFVVNSKGKVTNVIALKSIAVNDSKHKELVVVGYGSNKETGNVQNQPTMDMAPLGVEAVRVVYSMPKWIPGEQKGKAVSVKYVLPITFKLDNSPINSDYKEHANSEIIDGSKPLYLIDEKPATEAEVKALNPQDIKEVKVLKDATATALYGSRAANGVVLITMKK